ncbi:type IV pilin protein [Pseudomonas sp. G.S.17]|uniref:type IV pilin protein n=1 Tax=Pseudomonas sp. G.S.17 TaxID=3137451 RepID=UPI00311CB86B
MRKIAKGFTLIELMIVVAIVGILAAVAYPSYTEYVRRTHRAEIASLLSEQAQALERFYSRTGQYTDVAAAGGNPAMTLTIPAGNGFYTIVPGRAAQSFAMTATPVATSVMRNDKCGVFTLNQLGVTGNTGLANGTTSKDCWSR